MASCHACSRELPGEFPFCPFCGALLAVQPRPAEREERKVVSVLFCDLVGFTAASEHADPEDVRARLRPYHERLRREIERYGGTVEKFVGDAIMAVFGVPVTHEDDAQRAVSAGLRILEAIGELNEVDPRLSLQVRIGINSGEALVALGARLEEGEGVVFGDVVNTAARLQSAAPVNGVAVSEQTYRSTERLFEYEELEPVDVKGKSEPLAMWRPVEIRARVGSDVVRAYASPFVGRETERQRLIDAFERCAAERSCRLVTVVGEPGVGKSRMCAELFAYVEDRPGLVRWRQGRSLPYGEGIAFWALGEIVKAECGILESDTPEDAAAKLEHALPETDPDQAWLAARLQPLVGAGGDPAAQAELFTAWQRCLESWAQARETVLVFEDLHWADDAMLAFLERLAAETEGVPLLVLCTTRPELFERQPDWTKSLGNATTISLAPLSDDDTARLIATLLQRAVLPAETQRVLLEHAGGNPLYAEEFVRLIVDRGDVREVPDVPGSVQSLIAARLDTLPPENKSLLQDASVVGKVFWAGALAEMGGRESSDVELGLQDLTRRELVRPARRSSMDGEREYGFWHVLVRDVAYGQIPRATRAARHRAAAAWLERQAGERVEDLADVLAHHYLSALELARTAGRDDEVDGLKASGIRYLALAGERALSLDVDSAEQSLARALSLCADDDPERAFVLERWAYTAYLQGRLHDARAGLEQAVALHREQHDALAIGRALTTLSLVIGRMGGPGRRDAAVEALAVLENQPPGPELVAALGHLAGVHFATSDYAESIAAADRALALASELGLEKPARTLGTRGASRSLLGEREGLDDLRGSVELAVEQGRGREARWNTLAINTWLYEGPEAALATCREGIDFCEARGIAEPALWMRTESPHLLAEIGRTEEALAEAEWLVQRLEQAGHVLVIQARASQLRLLAERGRHEAAPATHELVAKARESGEPQNYAEAFTTAALVLLARGSRQEAYELVQELAGRTGFRFDPYYAAMLPTLVRTTLGLGHVELAARVVDCVEPRTPLAEHAVAACSAQLAEGAGDHAPAAALYADAAQRWRAFGNVPERAYALLGWGRSLLALGYADAELPLTEAQELFASLGYLPARTATEALLDQHRIAALVKGNTVATRLTESRRDQAPPRRTATP